MVTPKQRSTFSIASYRYGRIVAGTACLLLCCLLLLPNFADAAYTVSEKVYRDLTQAQTYVDKNQPQRAIDLLKKTAQQESLTDYEKAMVYNQLGYNYYQANQADKAIESFAQVVAIKNMPQALQQSSLYTLAQIYFKNEQYQKAIDTLRRWFTIAKNPSEEAYAFLAQAYYQTNNHRLVVDNINKALDILEAKNLTPIEQWLVMLQSSYSELGLIDHRVNVMKWLIRIYPKKDYFLALATAYGLLDKRSKQLAVMEIAYRKGFLEQSSELLTLASLLFSEGAPYKAAKVLAKGIEEKKIPATIRNLKFLASAWIDAKEYEKSIPVLKRAAGMATHGEIDIMVGNSYFNIGDWQAAAEAFQAALEKGDIDQPEKIWLLVGQCYLNLKQFATAEKIFAEAVKFETIKEKAQKWLRYVSLEHQRYRAYQAFQSQQSNP